MNKRSSEACKLQVGVMALALAPMVTRVLAVAMAEAAVFPRKARRRK